MGILILDMGSYEVEPNGIGASEYDDEVLCSGWIETLALPQPQVEGFENIAPRAKTLVNEDLDAFLRKMYALQR